MVTVENYDLNGRRIEDLSKVTICLDDFPEIISEIYALLARENESA